jgi:integrase
VVEGRNTSESSSGDVSDISNTEDHEMFKRPPYTELKADGIYRYRRRVPAKVVEAVGKGFLYRNLGKTKEAVMANWPKAHEDVESILAEARNQEQQDLDVLAKKDERATALHLVEKAFGKEAAQLLAAGAVDRDLELALWDFAESPEVAGKVSKTTQAQLANATLPKSVTTLSSVIDNYYDYKTTGDAAVDKRLLNRLNRCRDDLVASVGNVLVTKLPVEQMTRKDANTYRDYLLTRMTPSSVARYKNTINAVLNWHIKENGLDIQSVFAGLLIKGAEATKHDRLPLTAEDVWSLNSTFKGTPTEVYYTLLRDTGMRVGELAGLLVGDVSLQDRTLHIHPNDIRRLKTKGSERILPLSDTSVTLIQEHRQGKDDSEPLFAAYARPNGNTALSATLMKTVRKVITEKRKSLHSLRHSMKDNLRNTGCHEELSKAILGHSDGSVAGRYGSGYDIQSMREALAKVW